MPPDTIPPDVTTTDTAFDPADAFTTHLTGGSPEPTDDEERDEEETDKGAPEAPEPEDDDEDASDEQDGEDDEDPDADGKEAEKETPQTRQAADTDEVVIQIGDKAERVSVADLKRLFGQEASLTQKSQAVAEQRRSVDAEAAKYAAGIDKAAQYAAAEWVEYEKIDYLLAQSAMDKDAFAELREKANAAYANVKFYAEELGTFNETQARRRGTALHEAAQATHKAISDPADPAYIPGWSNETYNAIRAFAVNELKAPSSVIDGITDPWAIKTIHLAMQQVAAQKAAKALKPKAVVAASKTTAVKTKLAPASSRDGRNGDAMARLVRSGSVDDAANAFAASFSE